MFASWIAPLSILSVPSSAGIVISNVPDEVPSIGIVKVWMIGVVSHPPSTEMFTLTVSTRFPVFSRSNGNVTMVPGTAARLSGVLRTTSWTSDMFATIFAYNSTNVPFSSIMETVKFAM